MVLENRRKQKEQRPRFVSAEALAQKTSPSTAVFCFSNRLEQNHAGFWFLNNRTHKHTYLHWARQLPGCLWASCWQIIKDSKLLCGLKSLRIKLPTVLFDRSTLSWQHSLDRLPGSRHTLMHHSDLFLDAIKNKSSLSGPLTQGLQTLPQFFWVCSTCNSLGL